MNSDQSGKKARYYKEDKVPVIMFGHFHKEYQLELMRERKREEGRAEGQIS